MSTVPIARFPSAEWVSQWVSVANADPAFVAASRGWSGSAAAVIRCDAAMPAPTLYVRLTGADGHWDDHLVGPDPALTEGSVFTLTGDYLVWKRVVTQDLDPIRGVIQGRLRVRGQLSGVLAWAVPFRMMTRLAVRVPAAFIDEPAE